MRPMTIGSILLATSLSLFAPSLAADQPDDDPGQPAAEHEANDKANDEADEEETARPAFVDLEPFGWEAGVDVGQLFARSASGAWRTPNYYRIRVRRVLAEPLSVVVAADYDHRGRQTTPLTFTNRRFGLTVGAGLHHRFRFVVAGLDLELGGYWDRRSLRDATGRDTDGRLRPTAAATGRFGAAFFSTVLVAGRAGARLDPDDITPNFGLELSWLF